MWEWFTANSVWILTISAIVSILLLFIRHWMLGRLKKGEAGKGAIPITAPWLPVWEEEIAPFPYSVYNDQADSFSQFLGWIEKKKYKRSGRRYYK